MTKKLALLGATGLTGRAILREALARGHEVSALVRKPAALADVRGVRIVAGDALDAAAVTSTIAGCDAVIQALGVGGKGDGKPSTFVSDATKVLVDAMRGAGVRRLVCMSNVGAGDSWDRMPFVVRKIAMPIFLSWLLPILDDKNRMEPVVRASGLAWTLARFPGIVQRPATKKVRTSVDGNVGFTITVDDAATFLLDQIDDTTFLEKAVSASN
jgi:putative NADH-flavin reductase